MHSHNSFFTVVLTYKGVRKAREIFCPHCGKLQITKLALQNHIELEHRVKLVKEIMDEHNYWEKQKEEHAVQLEFHKEEEKKEDRDEKAENQEEQNKEESGKLLESQEEEKEKSDIIIKQKEAKKRKIEFIIVRKNLDKVKIEENKKNISKIIDF